MQADYLGGNEDRSYWKEISVVKALTHSIECRNNLSWLQYLSIRNNALPEDHWTALFIPLKVCASADESTGQRR